MWASSQDLAAKARKEAEDKAKNVKRTLNAAVLKKTPEGRKMLAALRKKKQARKDAADVGA